MANPERFVCIHGHFYQPPRENPWLETVEVQDSAAPYHDWNERITAECYATNGAARIVNSENQITRILNNYARMSFNYGPTLLSWLADNASRTYRMILDGERRSRNNFGGHSSAIAQVYNHLIMPLANTRDRITQIRWGIADYKHRFGIAPEGMWLAETAVDTESLELMAAEGIRFTILAPKQCKRVRPWAGYKSGLKAGATSEEGGWTNTPSASVDATHPYIVNFKSGDSIAIFFYDGPISRAVAFEGLLNSGEGFVARLKQGFHEPVANEAQLAHIATDGESYGHHHRHGEMALAHALRLLEQDKNTRLINYGSFLEKFPPQYEAEINEDTSWSCEHGVERWRSNCGCNGGKAGWNQLWRAPLREALDYLRDAVAPLTEKIGATLLKDVWAARDSYIDVILDRSPDSVARFFTLHQNHPLTQQERVSALGLMEMQRHTQLMYTSCGWFFDDISGIETVQIIAYAARVIQLSQELFAEKANGLEAGFLELLAQAKSNVPAAGDGSTIYSQQTLGMELGLEQVAAHYAISSVFSNYADETELFCYNVERISYESLTSGRARLALGRTRITSIITEQSHMYSFAVLHFGDQNITAAVKPYEPADAPAFEKVVAQAKERVLHANFPEVIRLLDRYYDLDYSLTSLFRDEQRRILQIILNTTLSDIEASLKNIYDDHASLLHYLSQAGLPKPRALAIAAEFAVNAGLRRALEADPVDPGLVRTFLERAKADEVTLDNATLGYVADRRMKLAMVELQMSSGSLEILERALNLAQTLTELPFEVNLWQAQNIWYEVLRSSSYALTAHEPEDRPAWNLKFRDLGCLLTIACDVITVEEGSYVMTREGVAARG